jgi:hypothetical protein
LRKINIILSLIFIALAVGFVLFIKWAIPIMGTQTDLITKTEQKPTSEFDLIADLTNFRQKMTELDTLTISFDHSVCTYQGYERIEITKKSDSINIVCNFKELTFDENPKWKKIYDRKISEKDTIWDIEHFLKRNEKRKNSDQNKSGILVLANKKDTIRYSTNGLIDLNIFLADYYETMRKIYPENKNGIYGVEIVEE